jgi:signal transduction histidine kinase
MTGNFWLDWALLAISLFNTVVTLWLGLTVLLNVERRTFGVWFMGGGLLAGTGFFISHTAILGSDPLRVPQSLNFWWQVGWLPVILAPFAWYLMVLWYSGYWSERQSALKRRHQFWLIQLVGLGVVLALLMIFAHPLPSFTQIAALDLTSTLTIGGVPILFVIFPAFIVLCIGLSLDALRNPGPSQRLMGPQARERTRPWLIATAVLLLIVSLMVAGFVTWVVQTARSFNYPFIPFSLMLAAILFDLLIQFLVAIAVVTLGQGIVSYEVFTGKVLPRRGFFRHWRSAVILALGYAILIGGSIAAHLSAIYSLLITTVLMTGFYALFSWRSFEEREEFMERLRPFVSSNEFVRHLTSATADGHSRAAAVFTALCRDLLNTSQAQLIPLGPLAELAGPSIVIPATSAAISPTDLSTSGQGIMALEESIPYLWAVPLWAERGQIGMLLLGPKQDGSLYTQEEVEIARASGERIVDMLAGEELARRLMSLQRQRLAESQVMDRRTRRALHDDVLPTLHTAVLRLSTLSRENAAAGEAVTVLSHLHHDIANLIRTPLRVVPPISQSSDFVEGLRHAVSLEFDGEFDSIEWTESGEAAHLDELALEVVFHAVREAARNAARYGRGSQPDYPLTLCISIQYADVLTVSVKDNGQASVSGASKGGTGGGLALHSTLLAVIGGSLSMHSRSDGVEVMIEVPLQAEAKSPA